MLIILLKLKKIVELDTTDNKNDYISDLVDWKAKIN